MGNNTGRAVSQANIGKSSSTKQTLKLLRRRRVLRPHRHIWVLIKNKLYDKVRAKGGDPWLKFTNLEDVEKDAENFRSMCRLFGASIQDIQIVEDPTRQELLQLFESIKRTVEENAKLGHHTHVHVHYSGHGISKQGSTWAVCNDTSDDFMIKIEVFIRAISQT